MKSFADWTQELAESVGEIQHHWETRKEAELKGMELQDYEEYGIEPNWQNPGAPTIDHSPNPFWNATPVPTTPAPGAPIPDPNPQQIPKMPPIVVAYSACDNCAATRYLYAHTIHQHEYHVCSNCLQVLTGGTP